MRSIILLPVLAAGRAAFQSHRFSGHDLSLGASEYSVDASSVSSHPPPLMLRRLRLHFLFMGVDQLPHLGLWKVFFQYARSDAWTAWVHCVNKTSCEDSVKRHGMQQQFTMVDTVRSQYCDDLVSPAVQLLRSALHSSDTAGVSESGDVDKYVLVSDTTLPLL
eukprot:TRINITY_DN115155_c0_g1_i1.p1 TRINITY_DN115155_c0_g1~~TRINITY_DN115155_c0_g1_i1.p1  ORF type:complete len:163 (-),score=18.02 TRINITY_DN115155_c0_g1_i1:46-534(-)